MYPLHSKATRNDLRTLIHPSLTERCQCSLVLFMSFRIDANDNNVLLLSAIRKRG